MKGQWHSHFSMVGYCVTAIYQKGIIMQEVIKNIQDLSLALDSLFATLRLGNKNN